MWYMRENRAFSPRHPPAGDCMDIATEGILGGEITRGHPAWSPRYDGQLQLELPFNRLATKQRKEHRHLSSVSFLASYGIRVLLVGAKIVDGKNGKLVLSCPAPSVAKVLKTAGIDR